MKYQQPYGIEDSNASYYNGIAGKRLGSIPPALAFEQPMRELVSAISNAGINPADTDLTQFVKAIRSGKLNYLTDTGPTNQLVGTPILPLDAYNAGLPIRIKVGHTNTGPVTLNVSNRGAVAVVKANGSALAANDILGGQILEVIHDGVNFQIVNFLGLSAGSTTNNFFTLNLPYVVDTGTPNALVGPYSPAITTLTAGLLISIRVINAINGPTTITVNANPPKAVTHGDGTPLGVGNAAVGQILLLVYDGIKFQLTGEGGIPPSDVVKYANFPWASWLNSAPMNPGNYLGGDLTQFYPRPMCPWAAGSGDPAITPAMNLSNGTFTCPAGLGGNWMFHCAILAAHCTYYLHVPPNLGGTFDYTATAPQQIRLYRGAVPPHAPPGYWTPDESNVIAGGIACPINPRITTDAGLTGSMLTMAHLNPGDTVQIGVQNNDPDVVLNRFVFNAIRLGKAS